MSGRVIFLLEEPSMKTMLATYLPRLIPSWQEERDFLLIAHQGKTDLDRSIPVKPRAWQEPGARFVIVRDNDNADCKAVKQRLQTLCAPSGRTVQIRLVCQELEAWYLGDKDALNQAYPKAGKEIQALLKRFPDPDSCQKPSRELERAIEDFQKHDGARRLGGLMNAGATRSHSLRVFERGIKALAGIA